MIYLDNASTTYIYKEVNDEIIKYLKGSYGNPSNLYNFGQSQKACIENARQRIAKVVGCDADEIFFTSGSSEGNTWALHQGSKCLCSPYEHHNITNNPKTIVVDEDYLERCLSMGYNMKSYFKQTFKDYVYSHMLVNNETGEIFSVENNFALAKELNMFTHCDMTQALGNIKIILRNYKDLDMVTFSGHKVHAPKGIGFCYIRKGVQDKIKPLLCGGGQEKGLRAGTENVPYIMGLAIAVEMSDANKLIKWDNSVKLGEELLNILTNNGVDFVLNQGAKNIPSIMNIALRGVEGESVMLALDEEGICVGTGSACNTGEMEPSSILKEMGVSNEYINGAIRFSFSEVNTLSDIKTAANTLSRIYKRMVE